MNSNHLAFTWRWHKKTYYFLFLVESKHDINFCKCLLKSLICMIIEMIYAYAYVTKEKQACEYWEEGLSF
jgi:hypothetical protein